MFKQHYDDIPRYTKRVYGDRVPQIEMKIQIKKMLMPLQKNIIEIIEIETSSTTQFDGESNFLYTSDKYMKKLKLIQILLTHLILCMVYVW